MAKIWQLSENGGAYNSGYIDDTLDCGQLPYSSESGSFSWLSSRTFSARLTPEGSAWLDAHPGVIIEYFQRKEGSANIRRVAFSSTNKTPVNWNLIATGTGNYFQTHSATSCSNVCLDDSDCSLGEKCLDGECVPCDKVVDGKGIVTLWGVEMSDGTILSDGLNVDVSSGVTSVTLSNFDSGLLTAGRIQIFNGFSGNLTVKAGIGILSSDFGANVTLFSGAVSGHYQDFIFDSGNLPFGYAFNGKITFEILNYDTLGDCADDSVDDTPNNPPIDVVDGGEPQPPGGSGPGTVTPPGGTNTIVKVIIIKPTPPQNTCECEKYLADALYYNFDSLGNRLIDLTNSFDARLAEQNSLIHSLFSDHNRILFEQFSQANRLSYEISLFLAKKFYPQLLKISTAIDALSSDVSIIKDSTQSISDDLSDIRDSLRLNPCEPDYPDGKTVAEIADDFEKHYYPTTVEVLENDVVLDTGSDEPDIFCRKLRK